MAMEILNRTDTMEFLVDTEEMAQDVSKVLDDVKDVRSDLALVANGQTIQLSHDVSRLLLNVLDALNRGTRISISSTPQEVSANTAAEMLGVSRPTFLKWAKAQGTRFNRIGNQKRFLTEDVLKLRDIQRAKKIKAFEALRRELDALQ